MANTVDSFVQNYLFGAGEFIAADGLLKYLLFGVAGKCIFSLCIYVHRREMIVNL